MIIGSLLPGSAKDLIGTTDAIRLNAQHEVAGAGHRVWHLGVFGFTALLLLVQAQSGRRRLYAVLIAFGLGLALEILQSLVYKSAFEWWDVRDDSIGVAVAYGLFLIASRLRAC